MNDVDTLPSEPENRCDGDHKMRVCRKRMADPFSRRTDAPLMDWAPIFTRTLLVVGLEFTAKWAPMETGATPMKSLVIAVLALGALAMPAHAQALKYLNINGNLFDVSAEPSVAAPRTTPAPKAKAKAVHHVKKRTAHKGSPT
jgi:hypothetical protein